MSVRQKTTALHHVKKDDYMLMITPKESEKYKYMKWQRSFWVCMLNGNERGARRSYDKARKHSDFSWVTRSISPEYKMRVISEAIPMSKYNKAIEQNKRSQTPNLLINQALNQMKNALSWFD